jgi:predicted TIM-barrel fold metal-dependent hydrolase
MTAMMRREWLTIGAGGVLLAPMAKAGPRDPSSPVRIRLPGICDTHVHVFDPRRFFYHPSRFYSPGEATVVDLMEYLQRFGLDRVVIVQPNAYGPDNSAAIDAVRRLGRERARGVCVVDERTPQAAIDEMWEAGFRGVRVNAETARVTEPAAVSAWLRSVTERIRGRPWHLQVNLRLSALPTLREQLEAIENLVCIEHIGNAAGADGPNQPGMDALEAMLRRGKTYVKVAAIHRLASDQQEFSDYAPLVQRLLAANDERVLFATDFPHPNSRRPAGWPVEPDERRHFSAFMTVDVGKVINNFVEWCGPASRVKKVLVDNPARLYEF